MKTRVLVLLATFSLSGAVMLPDVQATTTSIPANGKAIYTRLCVFCHGENGLGGTPMDRVLRPRPTIIADPVEMAALKDRDIYLVIKHGKPQTAMPVWGRLLSEAQIREVTQYVKSLRQALPAGMTRIEFDTLVGKRVYTRHCIVCHSDNGTGQSVLGRALRQRPQDFTNTKTMAHLSDDTLTRAIADGIPGTAMVGWKAVLDAEDIHRLVLYLRQITRNQ